MKITLLKDVRYAEDLKNAYRQLAKKYHPDVNPAGEAVFKQLQNEYEYLLTRLPKRPKDGETAGETMTEKEIEIDKLIKEMIDRLVGLEGVNIEIVGLWIWLDGNTYIHKDRLKELGFQWSKARKKWWFTPYDGAKNGYRRGKRYDFQTIRNIYGSLEVENKANLKIENKKASA